MYIVVHNTVLKKIDNKNMNVQFCVGRRYMMQQSLLYESFLETSIIKMKLLDFSVIRNKVVSMHIGLHLEFCLLRPVCVC